MCLFRIRLNPEKLLDQEVPEALRAKKVKDSVTYAFERLSQATNVSQKIEQIVNASIVHVQTRVNLDDSSRLFRFFSQEKRLACLMEVKKRLLL